MSKKIIPAGSTFTLNVEITCEKTFVLTDDDESKIKQLIYRYLYPRAKVSNKEGNY